MLNGGSNVQYAAGEIASRAAVAATHTLTVKAIQMAVTALKAQNAPMLDGGYYAGIIHPNVAYDLNKMGASAA